MEVSARSCNDCGDFPELLQSSSIESSGVRRYRPLSRIKTFSETPLHVRAKWCHFPAPKVGPKIFPEGVSNSNLGSLRSQVIRMHSLRKEGFSVLQTARSSYWPHSELPVPVKSPIPIAEIASMAGVISSVLLASSSPLMKSRVR